jgi:bla regulator protein blaR1
LPVASIVYLVLLVLPLLNFIRNYRYVQAIRQYGISKADAQWRMFVQKISAQMGITKPVHVWMSEFITSPVTIGYLKPIILLPVAAINHLSTQQTEAVLLHELSHIKRFDFLINLITRAIQTILYFNPFVNAFAKIIETEREKNCDEIVLQFQYEPHGYASALLALEKAAHTSSHTLAVPASGGKRNDLLTRIETIMGIRKKPVFSFNKLAGVMAALLCFISLNALLLLSKPGENTIRPGLLTDLTDPFNLFAPGKIVKEMAPAVKTSKGIEIVSTPVINNSSPVNEELIKEYPQTSASEKAREQVEVSFKPINNSPFINVNFLENIVPQLDQAQEEQVKEALIASKKVITEDQWKVVENSIADAMTLEEKERLKTEYKKAMSELDWEKMEERLKIAYDKIDWNQINIQLDKALVEIKIDSLQHIYTSAIAELSTLEKELKQTKQCGVPDTEITLKSVTEHRKEMQKAINKLKSVRNRKIVHL